ncbi:VOC family protein [Cytobacillus solani]|uniref:3-demethylubiquinone-9 3-methyltransferase n=1 Tax=Cytobacillus solani TaxID=1637975 RepID=A0A0Q3VG07_9BACI|nr:VOC family protein [Cytobacillus solani]KQL18295.1 3-demethylubiquinone-9 3-methyltransferase [Cytobacillus solani]
MTVQLSSFLMMNGNAKEAIEFYKEVLDAKLLFSQTFGDAPEDPKSPLTENMKDLVAHSILNIGETNIMVADMFPGMPYRNGNNVNICISTNEIEKTTKFYELLSQEGQVVMPLQQVHFSPAYGMITDKFGVTFQIFTALSEDAVKRGHQKDS